MVFSATEKQEIMRRVAACLKEEREVRKVVIFGFFLHSQEPGDLDIAIFQESDDAYLPLVLKYRRVMRSIADLIPLDVIPIRSGQASDPFLEEVARGEVIYERVS